MADQFDPPQHPLFGGGGYTWEPTGMAGATRGGGAFPPYHQPLGYDIYANAYQSPAGGLPFDAQPRAPSYGYLDPNRGFSTTPPSVLSSQRSQSFFQSEAIKEQRQMNLFTDAPPIGSVAPDPAAYYASDVRLGRGSGALAIDPFAGDAAWMAQHPYRGALAPSAGGGAGSAIVPYTGFGGTMPNAIYGGSGVQEDPRRLLDDFATALKEKLNPAMRESIETMKQLPSRAGGGGRGGFDGGSIGGLGGSFGGGGSDWIEGEWSEMPQPRGWGARFGDFARNLGGDIGNMLQNPDALSFNVWKASMAWRTFGGSPLNAADQYQQIQASQESMLMGAGISNYGDLMGGMYGNIARRRGRMSEFQYQYGEQASAAMSGIMDIMGGPQGGGGILGTIMALGGPALGAGLAAGALSGGNPYVAAAAGVGTLGIGALGYVSTNMQNYYGMGQAALNDPLQALINNPGGAAGVVGNVLTGNVNRQVAQSPVFARAVNQFAEGGVDLSQIRAQYPNLISEFSDADIFGQGLDVQKGNLATRLGLQREDPQVAQFFTRFLRYNQTQLPTQAQITNAITTQGAGIDSQAMARQYASAMGLNVNDLSLIGNMTTGFESGFAADPNRLQNAAYTGVAGGMWEQYAPLYRAAGLADPTNYAQLSRSPNLGAFEAQRLQVTGATLGLAEQYGDLFNATGGLGFLQGVQGLAEIGLGQYGSRFTSQYGAALGRARQARVYGGDMTDWVERTRSMSQEGFDREMAIQGGDRWALSQNWQQLGDSRYRTIDTDTGLPINEMRIRGLQDEQRGISRGLDTMQFSYANAARNMGYQLQAGGASIGAGGFAVGGDGLAGLAGIFASQGMGFNAGNGMGMWQVQDAFTMLQRRQQQSGIDMGGQGNDIARRRFELNSDYQERMMNMNRQQQLTTFDWQATGMAMDRNRAELGFGWQMEDYDRNIRYSTGRQRLDLMRQQERSTIMFSMDQTQRGQQEEQFETQKQWAKEEFDLKKEHFDESKKLSLEELDLTKRRFEENKKNMQEIWGLEDQRRLLDRQTEQLQFKMATDLAGAGREASLKLNEIADKLLFISRIDMDNMAWINTQVNQGSVGNGSGGSSYAPGAGGSGGSGLPAPLPPPTNTPAPRGGGGRTVPTPNLTAAGGESGLAPHLIRMIQLLEIIAAYGPMRMNTTVYTNDAVRTKDLYQQSKARVQ